MFGKILNKILGNRHEKDVKKMLPVVDEINKIYKDLDKLTDEQLKAKTSEYRARIKESVKSLEDNRKALQEKLQNEALDSSEILDVTQQIKDLGDEIYSTINAELDEILPEAFAVVRQACKRLKERGFSYTYAGQHAVWDMVPYDVQMIGGIVLHEGKIAEMATGEGKTLVAVAPVYLNALAGKGVHLVTVNDYLAKRDSEWMSPVYNFLGLTVGAIQSNMDNEDRKKIYNCDITYGTNNEFGFDYLRDNMVVDLENLVQNEHWFAIVDEVDSVLIDEARTPLIISGPVGQTDQRFEEMNPRVKRLIDAQFKLVNSIVAEAEGYINSGSKEDLEKAGVCLLRAYHGYPKHKKLTKLLQEPENQKLKRDTEMFFLRDKGKRMHEIDDELYYNIDEKTHQIDISEKGRELLGTRDEDANMFVIPDIAAQFSQIEGDPNLSPEEKQRLKDEAHLIFADRSDRIHTINQLLRAYSLYEKDVEYVIQDSKIMIVDEFTGRILDGRRYSDGLHQAIEAKENVKVERDTQTFATITLQNYFRLYRKLAGMTGTADTEAGEFEKIYKLEVTVIPTNRPIVRDDQEDLIFKTKREKYNAIIEDIKELQKAGRAVLVGTATVEVSEILAKMLKRQGVKHNVLNAKQHAKEAEIVSQAGMKGAVTIATNMAGRGTDIKLDHEVKKNGGLAILGSERHDARRIDRQLRGRAGRQGDPGSSIFYISLEDDLMRLFGGERIANVMAKLKIPEGEPIQHSMISNSVERAQKKVEENNFGIRKRLLEYDNVMNQQREVIYNRRRAALRGERLKGELFDYIEDMAYNLIEEFKPEKRVKDFKDTVRSQLLCEVEVSEKDFEKDNNNDLIERVIKAAKEFYERKEEMLGKEFMSKLERVAVLQTIDDKWREHLRVMDDLKEGIHLRSYGQKDPLLEYKSEAYGLFVELVKEINKESVIFAFKYFPQMVQREVKLRKPAAGHATADELQVRQRTASGTMKFEHSTQTPAFLQNVPQQQQPGGQATTVSNTFKRSERKFGRNDTVKVKYRDGKIVTAKYKKVEEDIANSVCDVLDDE
ncbi:MAG: preprotein translocase subunit SecA [Candidatus Kapabacteria bacterium]|nr:preprotein translocase subunit SecA [Ignavibacteriota bacterium]MCW5886230.1 preprotein translocase subunit SecA [Candidatus Kapabacteria bacterium]